MLQKLVITSLIFFSLICGSAAQQKPMLPLTCQPTETIVQTLKKFDQKLLFFADTDSGVISVYQNNTDKDWFVILNLKSSPEISCIVFDGATSETIIPIDHSGRHI